MLETYAIVLTQTSRTLIRNAKENPLLYIFFILMTLFSVVVVAGLTIITVESNLAVDFHDIVLAIFFVFLLKTVVDLYKHFINAETVTYGLSTPISHWKTLGGIWLAVFWTNLGIWVVFSGLYTVLLALAGVNLGYPMEYLYLTMSIIMALFLGLSLTVHFFSEKRWRLFAIPLLIGLYLYIQNIVVVTILLVLSILYWFYSVQYGLDSFLFARRKKRTQPYYRQKNRSALRTIFDKETTIMWRDNLYVGYIITAAITGAITGYLTLFGQDLFIPETVQDTLQHIMPSLYLFIGVYIVVVYTAVFPALNMFFNEEKTLWVLRHNPVSAHTIVTGKASSLLLSFTTALPFLAFYCAFTGFENLILASWLLVFGFTTAVIFSLPLGAKYLGKKSDILVLYSVALLVFIINTFGFAVSTLLGFFSSMYQLFFYCVLFCLLIVLLYGSLYMSSLVLTLSYKKPFKLVGRNK